MAITNRTLDVSEEQVQIQAAYQTVATGVTMLAAMIPYPAILKQVKVAAQGISGSPTYNLRVWRFIVGTGVTTIAGGATTLAGVALGTSGIQSMALAAEGSTLLTLLAGDVITLTSAGSNAAVSGIDVACVIQATQDIKSWY